MIVLRFFTMATSCLLIAAASFAQQSTHEKLIRVDDLSNAIDQSKADSYLNAVETKIGKLVKKYPQLASWNLVSPQKAWSFAGRIRSSDSLIYGHGLVETKSSKYLDRFGHQSLYIRLKIETQRSFARISGWGAGSVAHGWSVAGGCLIAQITTANPRNTKLERRLIDIIKTGVSREPCN